MLVDLVGSAVIYTVGSPVMGVSVEINISYLDAAYVDVSSALPAFLSLSHLSVFYISILAACHYCF